MEIPVLTDVTPETFTQNIYPKREPVILRGLDLGPCCSSWNPQYLSEKVGDKEVKVHISSSCQMDFINKNFLYRSLPFDEFVKKASEEEHKEFTIDETEKYYLRALGDNPRKDVADINVQFPQLSPDVTIPPLYAPDRFYSSVFRIASKGVQVWTHYDVMDNILMEIVGRKKVALYHPRDIDNLYMNGDKSEILDVENPDLDRFPKFASVTPYTGFMEPGDVLFIPALWLHNMKYEEFGVAVNVFWRHLDKTVYDSKDPYGNHDPVPAQRANQIVDRALKALDELPEEYRDFYARKLCIRIKSKACIADSSNGSSGSSSSNGDR